MFASGKRPSPTEPKARTWPFRGVTTPVRFWDYNKGADKTLII